MEKIEKRKRIVSIIFFALTVIFTLFALKFDLGAYPNTTQKEAINGFQIIVDGGIDSFAKINKWLVSYSVIVITLVSIEIAFYGIAIAITPYKLYSIETLFIILNSILTFIYMLNSFIINVLLYSRNGFLMPNAACIPFIIVLVFTVAHFLIRFSPSALNGENLKEKNNFKE